MKRFRMKKQKIVKPDGRWMYLYTFEEEPEGAAYEAQEQGTSQAVQGSEELEQSVS